MNIVLAPCGCTLLVDHDKGDRLCRCAGGGNRTTGKASEFTECRGGIRYAVHAEIVDHVTYTTRAL